MRKKLRRLFCTALCLFMGMTTVLPVIGAGEEKAANETERFSQNFDGCKTEDSMTEEHSNFGISYVTGRMQVVQNDGGRAVRIQRCDLRWWSMNYYDDLMEFSFTVSFDEQYADTRLVFNVQTHDPDTTTESAEGGRLVAVESDDDGNPYLADRWGDKLMDFAKDGTRYAIRIQAKYGSDTYAVYCNDALLSDKCTFASPIYGIFGARFHGEGGEDSYVTLDDIRFSSHGRTYAQEFSYQEPGELPSITLPPEPAEEGVTVWINDTKNEALTAALRLEDGSAWLPLADTMQALGGSVSADGKEITGAGGIVHTLQDAVLSTADASITLLHGPKTIDGVLYAPAQLFAETANATVWYDEFHGMVVLSTGEYRNDGILRKLGSILWQNGAPFWEISFNKFDLNWQILADASVNNGEYPNSEFPDAESCLAAAEESLRQLHENGFRTIRFFSNTLNPDKSEEEQKRYWAAVDTLYDLCDKYEIQVVPCLNLISTEFVEGRYEDGMGWVSSGEQFYDYFCDPNSASRQNVYTFLDQYVTRYKDRGTVLMWEIQNEGNLDADVGGTTGKITFSLEQLSAFYKDIANRIRQNDPKRMITGGDSILRSAQWHLFSGTMRGDKGSDWTVDSYEDRLRALALMHEGLDVISLHGYGVGYTDTYINADNKSAYTTWELFLAEGKRLGLPIYNGETGGLLQEDGTPAGDMPNGGEETAAARVRYLDTIVDAGIQLTHWWAFHSNRVPFGNDVDSWGVRVDDETAPTFRAICDANRKLQEKYAVNPLAAENTTELHPNVTIPADTTEATESGAESVTTPDAASGAKRVPYGWIAATGAAVAIGAAVVVTLTKRKKK